MTYWDYYRQIIIYWTLERVERTVFRHSLLVQRTPCKKARQGTMNGFSAVTAKRLLPWNSLFLFHRQIKFTENTVFSQVNACFSLCNVKKRFHKDRRGGFKGGGPCVAFPFRKCSGSSPCGSFFLRFSFFEERKSGRRF